MLSVEDHNLFEQNAKREAGVRVQVMTEESVPISVSQSHVSKYLPPDLGQRSRY